MAKKSYKSPYKDGLKDKDSSWVINQNAAIYQRYNQNIRT